jgi:argininosuccinate lyase
MSSKTLAQQSGHMGYGSRLKEQPAEELLNSAFAHEIGDGPLLYRAMSLADVAHVVMLAEAGLIPDDMCPLLLAGLLALHDIPGADFPFDPVFGDVYTNREQALRQRVAEGDGWLRTGRARRESSTVGYIMVTRERLLSVAGALLDLLTSLARQASAHLTTLMPDYTYLLKAHPTTLAHYLWSFASPLLRDVDRVQAAYGRVNLSPAGVGSVNGSRLPLNRDRLAALLGFEGLVAHTRDAMWAPDLAIEVMSVVISVMTTLDRLAEDLQLFATAEFGYVELADAHSRTSVIMPQKKNPYSLTFVRGTARHLVGALVSVITTNTTPSGQPDNRIFAYGEVPRALEAAEKAIRLLTGVLDQAVFDVEHMARCAASGFTGSTDLGDYLSEAADLDPRTAHRVIGLAVRTLLATQPDQQHITTADLDEAALALLGRPLHLPEAEVIGVQDPTRIVGSRAGVGGASPDSTRALIEAAAAQVAQARAWREAAAAHVAQAEATLLDTARRLAGLSAP